MFSLSLRFRLPAAMLALACFAALAVGWSAYRAVANWAQVSVTDRLGLLAESHARSIERRWDRLLSELSVQARSAYAVTSLDEIAKWMELGPHDLKAVVAYYRDDPALDAAARMERTGADHGHGYSWRHAPIHETYLSALRQFDYADVYLVSDKGRVVYSVAKGPEFGRLLSDPQLVGSSLAKVVATARDMPGGGPAILDFAPDTLNGGALRAFLAQRFKSSEMDSDASGTLVIAIDTSFIDHVLAATAGATRDIRSYVVGADGFLRSNSAARLGTGPRARRSITGARRIIAADSSVWKAGMGSASSLRAVR